MPVVSVNPFRCRLWVLHDRLEEHVTEETCKAEIESFLSRGQLVPALGRALRGDPDYDVELIYGARRLFVARHVNKPLMVELQELTDHEAILAMHIENRQRLDISPYERGLSYVSWLRAGHFASQGELARALGISTSQVSRLCRLAGLPAVVVDAFRNPAEIREEWGLHCWRCWRIVYAETHSFTWPAESPHTCPGRQPQRYSSGCWPCTRGRAASRSEPGTRWFAMKRAYLLSAYANCATSWPSSCLCKTCLPSACVNFAARSFMCCTIFASETPGRIETRILHSSTDARCSDPSLRRVPPYLPEQCQQQCH